LGRVSPGWLKSFAQLCGKDDYLLRTPNITLVHETILFSFDQVLNSLGETTKRIIYDALRRRGVGKDELASKFEEVERILVEMYGQGGRSVLIGTLARLCEEYSISLNLNYSDTLVNRLSQLTENILMQKLIPKHFRKEVDTRSFEDNQGTYAPWTG
jgi:hypothetical protein